ncbi:MAG TPA: hypothetical protein VGQ65_07785 [Thermoanaerobaculia bacterium]|jgi:hypothetical protein|nr:hypothetical protein [Thermoanaerobaculia bacterium]
MSLWPFSTKTPTPQEVEKAAFVIIESITRVGAFKVKQRMRSFQYADHQELVSLMQKADGLAWSFQWSWTEAARAWIMVKLIMEWTDSAGSWYPDQGVPRTTKMRTLLAQLGCMSEIAVRADLHNELSGEPILRRIHIARSNSQRTAWHASNFTDPRQHSIVKFRYIIHAMRPLLMLDVPTNNDELKKYYTSRYGSFLSKEGGLSIAELYLAHPEFLQVEALSCSIIDPDHTTTYTNSAFGLILSVPSGNICSASSTDMTSANAQNTARGCSLIGQAPLLSLMHVDTFLRAICGAYEYQLPSPQEVLQGSSGHNEVLVLGTFESDIITVSGIFIKVTVEMELVKEFVEADDYGRISQAIFTCSAKLKVPIVAIVEKKAKGCGIAFKEWVEAEGKTKKIEFIEKKKEKETQKEMNDRYSPPMGLTIGMHSATWRDNDVIREYNYAEIARRAQTLLNQNGNNAEQTHRALHDDDGLPHQVIEHVLKMLGHRNYL